MIILDENIPESQRAVLRSRRIALRQIGQDIGRKGMKDNEVIPVLPHLSFRAGGNDDSHGLGFAVS